ncbi:double hit isoform b [Anaeramoeba ignava]|uniref:Double hit isoform b n=1 Tax=Anaeramoeba ignava TaxID=1746090 RepID=A0A9Q0RGR1_ANAIG|nr:double hit isoform b [Anaeramoeba ignava]
MHPGPPAIINSTGADSSIDGTKIKNKFALMILSFACIHCSFEIPPIFVFVLLKSFFWFHVHNYQQFCLLWEDSIAKIHAEYIINNFLKEDSQNTINIPQEIQQNILSQLNQMGENPVATLFMKF